MDGAEVTKRYLKEQLGILGIKNLTDKELDKYTEGILTVKGTVDQFRCTNLIEFTSLLQERKNREDSDVSTLSSTSSLSISTLSSDQSKITMML